MLVYEFIQPQKQIDSDDFRFVESFLKSTGRTQLGWHYVTDITWIYSQVKTWPRELKILDAGGGSGPIQFLLTELGFDVTNIDLSLPTLLPTYRNRYSMILETLPSFVPTSYSELLKSTSSSHSALTRVKSWLKNTAVYKSVKLRHYAKLHDQWRSNVGLSSISTGKLSWYIGNLCNIPEISSATFDAVVSLSSLEHIPNSSLDLALAEIHRVLKPSARWAVTTSGTDEVTTWFHEPSEGLCFAKDDLETRFGAKHLNNQSSKAILDEYRHCSYLEENLAGFYKQSGKLGMPWGVWDPKYIPVGLRQ